METLYLLIPLSVALVFAAGAVFWWALASGQFDDLEGPGERILMDDETTGPPNVSKLLDLNQEGRNQPVQYDHQGRISGPLRLSQHKE
jgi:cbb3-type cytochrome oxidase maturation protein